MLLDHPNDHIFRPYLVLPYTRDFPHHPAVAAGTVPLVCRDGAL